MRESKLFSNYIEMQIFFRIQQILTLEIQNVYNNTKIDWMTWTFKQGNKQLQTHLGRYAFFEEGKLNSYVINKWQKGSKICDVIDVETLR